MHATFYRDPQAEGEECVKPDLDNGGSTGCGIGLTNGL